MKIKGLLKLNYKEQEIILDFEKSGKEILFPDFFIIGPQKTGTSWLWSALCNHPEIHMYLLKEPHYFHYIKEKRKDLNKNTLISYSNKFKVPFLWKIIKGTLMRIYFRSKLNHEVFGDGSATSAVIEPSQIRLIKQLNNKAKAIIILREPVSRLWSHVKMHFGKKISRISEKEIMDIAESKYFMDCANYRQIIKNWINCLGEENLLILWFEDLKNNPETTLMKTYEFLGVDTDPKFTNLILTYRYKSRSLKFPESLKQKFQKLLINYTQDFEKLKEEIKVEYKMTK